ncbi:MAG TPA: endonuclease MutS2 [Candidatus Atribacteria bacterium]|nr:endonuclease MutS2 [Candidatus Atribacteria bacterium]
MGIRLSPLVLETFDFDKIVERLVSFCSSSPTEELARSIAPFSPEEVDLKTQEAREALDMIQFDGSLSLRGLPDLRSLFPRIEVVDASLSLENLMEVLRFFRLTLETREEARERKIKEKYPSLSFYFDKIKDFRPLVKKMEKVISKEGYILDTASDRLWELRKKAKILQNRIGRELEEMLNSSQLAPLLQDRNYTQRRGRYVIPLKIQYRNAIDGLIIDYSSSGSTVFIEPARILELDNELELNRLQEEEEIARLLRELTSELRPFLEEIKETYDALIYLDLLQAKANLGKSWKGKVPEWGEKLVIRGGHHPLLGEKAVPFDLELSPDKSILVISGPNAGGKTVLLKSVALVVFLTFCGIPPPLEEGSSLPLYRYLFVDIGDHQDLENELSTFTYRLSSLKKALQEAESPALFLIDELGGGTDPEEGSALAIAILQYLQKRGVTTLVTTHLPAVKQYAFQEEGAIPASLAFDPRTLEPTYRLVVGEIGPSYGIHIAERVGIPAEIIQNAITIVDKREWEFNQLLLSLSQRREDLDRLAREYENKLRELREKEEELRHKEKELEKKREKIEKEEREEFADYLRQTQREISQLVGKLRKEERLDQEEYQKLKKRLGEEKKRWEELAKNVMVSSPEENWQEGETVIVDFLKQKGKIISLDFKKKEAVVEIEGRKVKTSFSHLEKTEKEEDDSPLFAAINSSPLPQVKNQIEIRALRWEEAWEKLEKYFDQVIIAGFHTVYIIHGKGEGILREATHQFLHDNPYVESFRLGYPEEGGIGVTVVTLKY